MTKYFDLLKAALEQALLYENGLIALKCTTYVMDNKIGIRRLRTEKKHAKRKKYQARGLKLNRNPWSVKNPLTFDERLKIAIGLSEGLSYGQLAKYVGRCKSVVMRESKRLGDANKYNPELAQKNFEQIQINRRRGKK